LKENSIWSYFTDVRAFLNWAVDQELLDKNPTAKLKVKQGRELPKPYTDQELEALWKVVAQEPRKAGVRNRALLAFLIDTGVRAGEVCGIKPEDFLWDTKLVLVSGKTGPRMVAFSPRTAVLLRKWAVLRDPDVSAFFQTYYKQAWTPNGLLKWVVRLGEKSGVQKSHPHRFRATYATRACATGNLFAVQAQLGHSTLLMTRRYASVTAKTIRDNHDATSPMNDILGRGKDR
jgi:integrase/recombinase XerD